MGFIHIIYSLTYPLSVDIEHIIIKYTGERANRKRQFFVRERVNDTKIKLNLPVVLYVETKLRSTITQRKYQNKLSKRKKLNNIEIITCEIENVDNHL